MDTLTYINHRLDAIGRDESERACKTLIFIILLLFLGFFEEIIESRLLRRWLAPMFGG